MDNKNFCCIMEFHQLEMSEEKDLGFLNHIMTGNEPCDEAKANAILVGMV